MNPYVAVSCLCLGGCLVCAGCILYGWWADRRWRRAAGRHPAVKVERGRGR